MSRKKVPILFKLCFGYGKKSLMKLAVFLFFLSYGTWAKPLVLLAYFDAFGRAPFNNSEKVALLLKERVKNHADFDLRLCSLQTVFDKSFSQIEDCLMNLEENPKLVLGLGESNCNFKIETMGRNYDRTRGADNEGNHRRGPIIMGGQDVIGFNYPLAGMYCSLPKNERSKIEVSNDAGSFVCNNVAYQFAHHYKEVEFGFIHVPAHNCRNLGTKTRAAVDNLAAMIPAAVKTTDVTRLLTRKDELEALREASRSDQCLYEFYKRTKGTDEKGFWRF